MQYTTPTQATTHTTTSVNSMLTKFAKSILLCLTAVFLSMQMAFAVDVNRASFEELDAIKGIGVKKAQAIIDERNANGAFKDAADLAARVKGLGDKSVSNLMAQGLTINGAGSGMTTIAPQAAKTTKEVKATKETKATPKATADLSGGQTSVTTQNNAPAAKSDAKMNTKVDDSSKRIIIPASQTAANATLNKTITPAEDKKSKQGYPKAASEMTVKPAKNKEAKEAKAKQSGTMSSVTAAPAPAAKP